MSWFETKSEFCQPVYGYELESLGTTIRNQKTPEGVFVSTNYSETKLSAATSDHISLIALNQLLNTLVKQLCEAFPDYQLLAPHVTLPIFKNVTVACADVARANKKIVFVNGLYEFCDNAIDIAKEMIP